MILLKNTASQVVYAKLIDTLTGTPVTGVLGANITSYISKDGDTETTTANTASGVGHGIYKLTLTQSETNCTTGVINMIHNANSQYQFETLYFQTTEPNPSVNVLQNNDKIGYFLDSVQSFSTSGSVGSVSNPASIESLLKNSTYDGITQQKLYEMILAFIAGKVVVTIVDANTRGISYKKRNGSTETFSVTVSSADGSRATGGVIAP